MRIPFSPNVVLLALSLSAAAAQAEVLDHGPAQGRTDPANFTGPYLTLQISKSNGPSFISERSIGASSGAGEFTQARVAVGAGYDTACGVLVCGISASFMPARIEAYPTEDADFGCDDCTVTVRNLMEIKARLGYPVGNALLFVTLGPTRADVAATADWNGIYTMGAGALSGRVAEVGVEYAATGNTSVSVTMAHTDLGRLELPTDCSFDCFTDVSFTRLKVGLVRRW